MLWVTTLEDNSRRFIWGVGLLCRLRISVPFLTCFFVLGALWVLWTGAHHCQREYIQWIISERRGNQLISAAEILTKKRFLYRLSQGKFYLHVKICIRWEQIQQQWSTQHRYPCLQHNHLRRCLLNLHLKNRCQFGGVRIISETYYISGCCNCPKLGKNIQIVRVGLWYNETDMSKFRWSSASVVLIIRRGFSTFTIPRWWRCSAMIVCCNVSLGCSK